MDILTELEQLAERTRETHPEVAVVLFSLLGALAVGDEITLARICADFSARTLDKIKKSNLGPSLN